MSSSIWTRCGGDSEVGPLRLSPWRAVEAQHQVSTRKLVDTLEEHAVLEDLIEGAKPPDPTRGRLHYLLATPFRYPPLRYGSRFGTRYERGVWYGADARRTVFAEVAYYRLLFLEGSRAELGVVTTQLTAFTVRVRTAAGVDLTGPRFAPFESEISSRASYAQAQALGASMRAAGVEVFRYRSARDVAGGVGVGIFSPAAFGSAKPRSLETWHCTATRERVELLKRDYFERRAYAFPVEEFRVGGRLPAPAV